MILINTVYLRAKEVKYNDLQDLVYKMQSTCDEIIDLLDLNYNPTKRRYSLSPSVYEVADSNETLKQNLSDNVTVKVTIDDFRIKFSL